MQTEDKSVLSLRKKIVITLVAFVISQIILYLTVIVWGAYNDVSMEKWCRLDCGWYRSIVTNGYDLEAIKHQRHDAANWAFFPLFPFFSSAVSYLLIMSPQEALVVVSKFFHFLSIFTLVSVVDYRYGQDADPYLAAALVAVNPYLIFANSGYSETMYFFLMTTSFLYLYKGENLKAAISTSLLTATRLVGIVTSAVVIFNTWVANKNEAFVIKLYVSLLSVLGLAIFMCVLFESNGDPLAFVHIQRAWDRTFYNPLKYIIETRSYVGTNLISMCSMLFLAFVGYRLLKSKLKFEFFSLILASLLPLLSSLNSMPRYIFWQYPMLLGIYLIAKDNPPFKAAYFTIAIIFAVLGIASWLNSSTSII